jgi:hypothetical protein
MQKIILFCAVFIGLAASSDVWSQKTAVTDEGEIVILYQDGTWEFQEEIELLESPIDTNPTPFIKNAEASFLLKSKVNESGFYLDTKKWSYAKGVNNPDAEYEFQLKGGDLYAMAITERVSIPLTVLKNAALTNARSAAPNIHIINEEYRTVNGLNVLMLEMQGRLDGIDFTYYGYYTSSASGSTQWIVYTSTQLINEYPQEIESLLNGLTKQ